MPSRTRPEARPTSPHPTTPPTPPRGFLQGRLVLRTPAATYLADATEHLSADTQRLLFHLVACHKKLPWSSIPVSAALMRQEVRRADTEQLVQEEFIHPPTPYNRKQRRSREFEPHAHLMDELLRHTGHAYGAADTTLPPYVDVFELVQRARGVQPGASGCASRAQALYAPDVLWAAARGVARGTRTCDEHGNRYGIKGSPLYDAMPVYRETKVCVDVEAARAYLGDVRAYVQRLDEAVGADAAHLAKHRAYARAFLLNETTCFEALDQQGFVEVPGMPRRVRAAHAFCEPQTTGRLTVHGMQNASRGFKGVAFASVPGIRNYDLAASQVRGLLQRFEEANENGAALDATWLARYDGCIGAKLTYSAEAGLSVDRWKLVLCAVMMGCSFPTRKQVTSEGWRATMTARPGAVPAVLGALLEESPGDLGRAYDRLYGVIGPLVEAREAWYDYLVGVHVPRARKSSRGGPFVPNEAGARFFFDPSTLGTSRVKRQLAAFMLQGLEAAFIHALAVESTRYAFEVVQNEHDGLITLGEIPQAAIEAAKARSGLRRADLVVKPFEQPAPDLLSYAHMEAGAREAALAREAEA